jgi:hypothetical protein
MTRSHNFRWVLLLGEKKLLCYRNRGQKLYQLHTLLYLLRHKKFVSVTWLPLLSHKYSLHRFCYSGIQSCNDCFVTLQKQYRYSLHATMQKRLVNLTYSDVPRRLFITALQ